MHTHAAIILSLCCSSLLVAAEPERSDSQSVLTHEDATLLSVVDERDSWSLTDLRLRDTTLYWENDGTIPNWTDDTDRFYTNGLGLEFSFDPNLTDELASKLAPSDDWNNPRFGASVALKQLIFTGGDISDPAPALSDHPYGGILYLAFSFQRADDKKHDHFELDLGVVGEMSQAEAVQRFIHKTFPDELEPQGWGNQLANEAAINFTFERTWKSERASISGIDLEMLPAVGFDLGNVYTRARARITLRAGKNLPNDFGPPTLLGHKDHTVEGDERGQGDWSFYVFATLGMDAVAHNIFYDGNTFANSRSVDSEPFVALATLGIFARYKSVYLGWAQHFQTESFEGQPNLQTWGTIALGVAFDF